MLSMESLHGWTSGLVSMTVHAGLVILLTLVSYHLPPEERVMVTLVEPDPEERLRPEEIELDNLETMSDNMSFTVVTADQEGMEGKVDSALTNPPLEITRTDDFLGPEVSLETFDFVAKNTEILTQDVPKGTVGSVQAVVGDYEEAMDQISQELIWLLSNDKVLVVWLFDQSESMKEDQGKIRQRIERIYAEVGLSEHSKNDALTTAVCSYGQGFDQHTTAPTHDRSEIDQAIAAVPIDPSGREFMCSAIIESLSRHRRYAKIAKRKIALILVSDESGESPDNEQNLEKAIAIANATDTRVYILGREAVFGYPFAHVRWIHPEDGSTHLLPVDRGPETAMVEQLQTDGFGARKDSMASGFGPFEQVRLARETGGIFFMLPDTEADLFQANNRKYDAEILARYRPAGDSRLEQMEQLKREPLRAMIYKIIHDLNPYDPAVAEVIEIRQRFSAQWPQLQQEVRREQAKMITYIRYLDQAIEAVEKGSDLRDDSTSLRTQANYDLLYGQLLAYRARAFEYGAYLTEFVKAPRLPAPPAQPYLEFRGWRLETQEQLAAEQLTASDIELSKTILRQITQEHAGTPWATRAAGEVRRGFGVKLEPVYFDTRRVNRPRRPNMPARMPMQVPNL